MDTVLQSRTLDPGRSRRRCLPISCCARRTCRRWSAGTRPCSTCLSFKKNDFITFLTYDDEHHRLAIVNVPDLHKADGNGLGPGARRLHVPRCRRTTVHLSPPEGQGHRALPADPSRADAVDVLSRFRRQLGRDAGRLLQDQGGQLGLLPDRGLHARTRSASTSTPRSWSPPTSGASPKRSWMSMPRRAHGAARSRRPLTRIRRISQVVMFYPGGRDHDKRPPLRAAFVVSSSLPC